MWQLHEMSLREAVISPLAKAITRPASFITSSQPQWTVNDFVSSREREHFLRNLRYALKKRVTLLWSYIYIYICKTM